MGLCLCLSACVTDSLYFLAVGPFLVSAGFCFHENIFYLCVFGTSCLLGDLLLQLWPHVVGPGQCLCETENLIQKGPFALDIKVYPWSFCPGRRAVRILVTCGFGSSQSVLCRLSLSPKTWSLDLQLGVVLQSLPLCEFACSPCEL